MNKKLKTILGIGAGLFFIAAIFGYVKFFSNNTTISKPELYVTVPTGSIYEDVKKIISPYVASMSGFEMMASLRKYNSNVKPGRFLIKKGMGNFALVASLRKNAPVKLAFNNQERLEDLCVRFSSQIEPDTTKLLAAFRDSIFLKHNGFTKENVIAMFIPNSYEFYWNTSAEKFRDKMLSEYKNFWNKERLAKAEKLGLTPVQVITLASIVHKETVKTDERPKVAKVYLNRLEQGMPLQADPTVIYSLKLRDNDFNQVIKRVLYNDLTISSPYNTYVNIGLPPGPIALPDISAIDAVLNPDNNDYIYFCASVERFGYHEFASTYAQHQVNAKKYADWLNTTGTNR
ncbi:endolytic transglycosylase MltG [Flavobacterium sp. SUN052]|uniref:endolytic transglycosylase MltG n=1 Tax=Flavobacterium sp. SUN052 TaxID=3002441 RepID=UPI00237E61AA|nr:endolytic transglycosylase MltG [Flavobacterium sp. SUN052]MEC4005443.1 endolytic transglycosylase MltG [Flavobacterium sp. SUN052]